MRKWGHHLVLCRFRGGAAVWCSSSSSSSSTAAQDRRDGPTTTAVEMIERSLLNRFPGQEYRVLDKLVRWIGPEPPSVWVAPNDAAVPTNKDSRHMCRIFSVQQRIERLLLFHGGDLSAVVQTILSLGDVPGDQKDSNSHSSEPTANTSAADNAVDTQRAGEDGSGHLATPEKVQENINQNTTANGITPLSEAPATQASAVSPTTVVTGVEDTSTAIKKTATTSAAVVSPLDVARQKMVRLCLYHGLCTMQGLDSYITRRIAAMPSSTASVATAYAALLREVRGVHPPSEWQPGDPPRRDASAATKSATDKETVSQGEHFKIIGKHMSTIPQVPPGASLEDSTGLPTEIATALDHLQILLGDATATPEQYAALVRQVAACNAKTLAPVVTALQTAQRKLDECAARTQRQLLRLQEERSALHVTVSGLLDAVRQTHTVAPGLGASALGGSLIRVQSRTQKSSRRKKGKRRGPSEKTQRPSQNKKARRSSKKKKRVK